MVRVYRSVLSVLIQASMEKLAPTPKFRDGLVGTEMPLVPSTLMA